MNADIYMELLHGHTEPHFLFGGTQGPTLGPFQSVYVSDTFIIVKQHGEEELIPYEDKYVEYNNMYYRSFRIYAILIEE